MHQAVRPFWHPASRENPGADFIAQWGRRPCRPVSIHAAVAHTQSSSLLLGITWPEFYLTLGRSVTSLPTGATTMFC